MVDCQSNLPGLETLYPLTQQHHSPMNWEFYSYRCKNLTSYVPNAEFAGSTRYPPLNAKSPISQDALPKVSSLELVIVIASPSAE